MKESLVSNDFIAQEVKTFIPFIYSCLKRKYQDIKFKTENELGTLYTEYLDYTYKKFSTVKTILYKNEGKFLYDFYENILLRNSNAEELLTDNTEKVFEKSKKVIITGTGGIGKSMFVKHVFINQIQMGTSIPIFIELKSVNDYDIDNQSFIQFIHQEVFNQQLNLNIDYFIESLECGKYTIILDGLDEINSSKRSWVDREIKGFVDLFHKNRYIISSRPSEEFIGWNDFVEWELQKMSKEQALSLINRLEYETKVKRNFARELKSTLYDKHESFASIPLLLTIMLITYESGASIPNNLTDFYNQAFYTLYQRHDASKSGYKRELHAELPIEKFKEVLSFIAVKTFFIGQVDFDILNVGEFIKIYNEKNSLNIVSSDFIYDAVNSACMLIQEGVNLKFSHRSFQEYFAALGINQLDDSRQEKVLISWVESDTNNLIAHRTFIETLFSIQRERTYHNLCIPVIIKSGKLFEEWNDNEKILQALFKSFMYDTFGREEPEISFTLSKDLGYYFRLQFFVFRSIGIEISDVSDYKKTKQIESQLFENWEKDFRRPYSAFSLEDKLLLQDWMESWFLKRHKYLYEWAIAQKNSMKTKKRSFLSIIDDL